MDSKQLISNTKRAMLKELHTTLSNLFVDSKTPVIPLLKNKQRYIKQDELIGVRFDVADVNYDEGAIIYAITKWGDLIYSFPGDSVCPDKNKICNFEIAKPLYHDLTPDDLYIEGIDCLIQILHDTYSF